MSSRASRGRAASNESREQRGTRSTRPQKREKLPPFNFSKLPTESSIENTMSIRCQIGRGTEIEFIINADDEFPLERHLELMQLFSQHGELSELTKLAEDLAENKLLDFKQSVKSKHYSPAEYEIVQQLNAIEDKVYEYPLITPKEATRLLGMFSATNPSRDIAHLVKSQKLFGFSFGETKTLQIPAFQFNTSDFKIWEPVSRLCGLLGDLNDWAVYDWMTTFDDDLETTPALALQEPDKYADLIDLAGLYRNENKHAHLSYTAEK